MSERRFAGRVAIVTGGGSGIGRGIAKRLAREGCSLVVADIVPAAAEATTAQITSTGDKAVAIACDVTNVTSVQHMLDSTITAFGHLDYLVNNAGASPRQNFDSITPESWSNLIHLNLTSQFLCVRAAVPYLRKRDSAAIVNIASLHAWATIKGLAPYAAAKGGVVALTNSLAIELAPRIRVNAIAPGVIETEAWHQAVEDVEAARQQRLPYHLVGRLGLPEDIAAAAAFLLSEDASFITGITLPVDGGLMTQLYPGQ